MGEAPVRVHIIRSGAVELSRQLRGRRVVLQILRPGDVLGDIPLFVRMTEPFDAVALEDSIILSIDSVTLYRLLEKRPRLAWRWLQSVSNRMASVQGGWWSSSPAGSRPRSPPSSSAKARTGSCG
jgi:CRP-like cAMP-binding protein